MLSSPDFEYDLAARRVYELKQDLYKWEEEDEEYEDYRRAVRYLNQIRHRRNVLDTLLIEIRPLAEGSEERQELLEKYDRVKGEVLVRCAKISAIWERTIGIGYEQRERERLGLRKKYR